MRTALTTILLTLCVLLPTGCGEEPEVRQYEATRPAAYDWPQTESREAGHEAGGINWVWQVPAGWVVAPEVPDQLVADYRFKGTSESLPGRLTVSVIDGDAGGIRPNAMRWLGQLYVTDAVRLGPGDTISEPMPVAVGEATFVELAGQYQGPTVPTHLAGWIIQIPRRDGQVFQTWFFKLVGDKDTVDANLLPLAKMIESFQPKGIAAPRPEPESEPAPEPESDTAPDTETEPEPATDAAPQRDTTAPTTDPTP